jgi:hypothetical protein
MNASVKLPRRSRKFGVGKEIGGAVYVHRRYEAVLGEAVERARERLPEGFAYTVVKWQRASGAVSFIASPDFNAAAEPVVGDVVTVGQEGGVKMRRQGADPTIYHHKWLMVADDYEGFDVEESKERSRRQLALADVDRRRIGRRSYWLAHVAPRLQ